MSKIWTSLPSWLHFFSCSRPLSPSNVKNLTWTLHHPTTSTVTTHKSRKFCDIIVWWPVFISSLNTAKKCFLNVPQVHPNTNMYGLRILLPILTKFKKQVKYEKTYSWMQQTLTEEWYLLCYKYRESSFL